MWNDETRARYERRGRYPSDVTDEEWALIAPHMPPIKQRSRRPSPAQRDVLNAVLYVLTSGCQWRQLPKDFPPKSTVHDYFVDWQSDGTLARIHHALYVETRRLAEKSATPSLAIVDSQSVKSAEKGGSAAILPDMMRARKSKARSATSAWTRSV
jgi:transposase